MGLHRRQAQNGCRRVRTSGKKIHIGIKILIGVLALILLLAGGFFVMRIMGKGSLYKNPENALKGTNNSQGQDWQDGDISFNGEHYRYNKDILTFLVMGIDSMDPVPGVGELDDYTMGAQADAQFLVVLDPTNKTISLVAINRNSMVEMDTFTPDNTPKGRRVRQITVAHGYGDGRELSCERAVKAASELFYNLPIHGYCAVNMGAIPQINDSIGGIEVEVLDPIKDGSEALQTPGNKVLLQGMDAFWYLKYRDITVFDSAGMRLNRQKQYLNVFVSKVKEATKANIAYPIELYNAITPYMVTDVTTSEISYLAPELIGYTFDSSRIYSMEGETVKGERFEEFYPDEEALRKMIVELFYTRVE